MKSPKTLINQISCNTKIIFLICSRKYCLQNALKFATTYAEQCDYLDTEDDASRLEYGEFMSIRELTTLKHFIV